MFPPVLEHVEQRVPHLARRRERPKVVAIVPDPSVSSERAIDRLRDTDRQALDAAAQLTKPVVLEDQVDVVALNAEMEQPKSFRGRLRERRSDRHEDAVAPQRRQSPGCPQRDMYWTAAIVHGSPPMWHATSSGCRFPSRAFSPATPCRRRCELELSRRTVHLDSGTYYNNLATMSIGADPLSAPESIHAIAARAGSVLSFVSVRRTRPGWGATSDPGPERN